MATTSTLPPLGLFQQIRGWELDVGYRHLQLTSGQNIALEGAGPPWSGITYLTDVREIGESIDAGFSYTTRLPTSAGPSTRARPSTAPIPIQHSGWAPTLTSPSTTPLFFGRGRAAD